MALDNFSKVQGFVAVSSLILWGFAAQSEPSHAIAMYGAPTLPADFANLPYVNPDAPKGGAIVLGNTGGYDSLNPFVLKGTSPWQLPFFTHETLMGRSWDEPFTLYGLLAETVETDPDRTWVEFTLRLVQPNIAQRQFIIHTVCQPIWSHTIKRLHSPDDRIIQLNLTNVS